MMRMLFFLLLLSACSSESGSVDTVNQGDYFSSDQLIDDLSEYFGESQQVEKTLRVNDQSSTEIKDNYSISSDLTRLLKPYDLSGPSNADKFKKELTRKKGQKIVSYTALDSLHDIRYVELVSRDGKLVRFKGERASDSFITDDSETLEIVMGDSYQLQSQRKSRGKDPSTMLLKVTVIQ